MSEVNIEDYDVVVIVPCYNEEAAIGQTVRDLRAALPSATVYVYDNNSSDATISEALAAGALVRSETRKGKGNVMRRAFADLEADVYVMIDGDDTYDAAAAPQLVQTLLSGPFDHVVGVRTQQTDTAYRPGHATGNKALTGVVGFLYGRTMTDMLSGYRALSHRYVKSFPAISQEFEVETELTIHSLHLRVPTAEVPVGFKDRPEGSESKLRTYRDGWRILSWILNVTRHERPVLFHGLIGAVLGLVATVLGVPVVIEFIETGLVPRFPTAILSAALMIISAVTIAVGYILDAIGRSRVEAARLSYLRLPALDSRRPR